MITIHDTSQLELQWKCLIMQLLKSELLKFAVYASQNYN